MTRRGRQKRQCNVETAERRSDRLKVVIIRHGEVNFSWNKQKSEKAKETDRQSAITWMGWLSENCMGTRYLMAF